MALERKTFTYEDITLSFFMIEDVNTGDIWMSGSSIAKSLGYKQVNRAIADHVTDKNKLTFQSILESVENAPTSKTPPNWQPNTMMINEAGLNQLIMRSKLPNALKFQDWVCSEVLPSIRKTGKYEIQTPIVNNTNEILEDKIAKLELEKNLIQSQSEVALIKSELKIQQIQSSAEQEILKEKLVTEQFKCKAHELELQNQQLQNHAQQLQNQMNMMTMYQDLTRLLAIDTVKENEMQLNTIINLEGRVVNEPKNPKSQHAIVVYSYRDDTSGNENSNIYAKIKRCQLSEVYKIDAQIKNIQKNAIKTTKHPWMITARKELQINSPNATKLWLKVREEYPHKFFGFNSSNSTSTNLTVLTELQLREKYRNISNELKEFLEFYEAEDDDTPIPIHLSNFKMLKFTNEDDAVDRCLTKQTLFMEELKRIISQVAIEANQEIEAVKDRSKRRKVDNSTCLKIFNYNITNLNAEIANLGPREIEN